MDFSTSSASSLARPRITLAIITAVAAASVGIYIIREARLASPHPTRDHSQGLHRSNAVRRPRRRRSAGGRRDSTASSVTSTESHGDENVDINAIRPQIDGGDENADINIIRPQTDGAETVGEETIEENWWDDPSQMPIQRAGQNIVSLLFRVSEDNARRNAYVHRGCACNACGIVPIRGIRYRCANCSDFDLCETCESQGLHIKTHIFYKVKIPAPPFVPRHMQSVWYPGDPDTCLRNLPRYLMVKLSRETGFERPELEAFWEQWTFMANTEWREDPDDLCLAMDRKTFERCLVPSGGHRHSAPNLIYDRMFSFYDTNNDDLIGFTEFLHGLSYRKRKDKLRKIFEGYDVDRDGYVDRRDFLRIFRAYYVLYKQMHKDILDGLDDQVMSSTEAHQLISSRQPLSSLFGREGAVPRADRRQLDGKTVQSNGDVVLDDEGVEAISEDKPDTSKREEILTNLFGNGDHRHTIIFSDNQYASGQPQSPSAQSYWDALLNPPSNTGELSRVLIGDTETRFLDEILASNGAGARENGDDAEENGLPNGEQGNEDGNLSELPEGTPGEQPPAREPALPTMDPRWIGQGELRAEIQTFPPGRPQMSKEARIIARRKLHDRWKRRQFYLDEEEGATPPDDWAEDEDVLVRANAIAESSKSAQALPMSPRSRSSSKVRFAEDTDDYETRSNPSTSSRSIPERWGGMDIPDAERDAGKEILYQVTQQAFNELLDILFKAKEDLALRAAESKQAREKHRPLFDYINLEDESSKSIIASSPEIIPADDRSMLRDDRPASERPLRELLEESGYTIVEVPGEEGSENDDKSEPSEMADGVLDKSADAHASLTPPLGASEARDPTMPQFRPNSLADIPQPTVMTSALPADSDTSSSGPGFFTPAGESSRSLAPSERSRSKAPQKKNSSGKAELDTPTPIPYSTLFEWKRLDAAEQEAKQRGGWGKLSYAEFKTIYTSEENNANRLDYLGSWIDFCIP